MTRRDFLWALVAGMQIPMLSACGKSKPPSALDKSISDGTNHKTMQDTGSTNEFDWVIFLATWNSDVLEVISRAIHKYGIALGRLDVRQAIEQAAAKRGVRLPTDLFAALSDPGDVRSGDHNWKRDSVERIGYVEKMAPEFTKGSLRSFEWEVLKNDGLGFLPCSSEKIRVEEDRLGVDLPSSYKQFLLQTNGWITTSSFLLPLDQVGKFSQLHPEDAEPWANDPPRKIGDAEYFVYGPEQYPYTIRGGYVPECLVVSRPLEALNDWWLLNPAIKFDPDEWEAWYLSPRLAGASRFRSFRDLMVTIRQSDIRVLNKRLGLGPSVD